MLSALSTQQSAIGTQPKPKTSSKGVLPHRPWGSVIALKPTPIWDHLGCGGISREGEGAAEKRGYRQRRTPKPTGRSAGATRTIRWSGSNTAEGGGATRAWPAQRACSNLRHSGMTWDAVGIPREGEGVPRGGYGPGASLTEWTGRIPDTVRWQARV
jgi:hypothetical protein